MSLSDVNGLTPAKAAQLLHLHMQHDVGSAKYKTVRAVRGTWNWIAACGRIGLMVVHVLIWLQSVAVIGASNGLQPGQFKNIWIAYLVASFLLTFLEIYFWVAHSRKADPHGFHTPFTTFGVKHISDARESEGKTITRSTSNPEKTFVTSLEMSAFTFIEIVCHYAVHHIIDFSVMFDLVGINTRWGATGQPGYFPNSDIWDAQDPNATKWFNEWYSFNSMMVSLLAPLVILQIRHLANILSTACNAIEPGIMKEAQKNATELIKAANKAETFAVNSLFSDSPERLSDEDRAGMTGGTANRPMDAQAADFRVAARMPQATATAYRTPVPGYPPNAAQQPYGTSDRGGGGGTPYGGVVNHRRG